MTLRGVDSVLGRKVWMNAVAAYQDQCIGQGFNHIDSEQVIQSQLLGSVTSDGTTVAICQITRGCMSLWLVLNPSSIIQYPSYKT